MSEIPRPVTRGFYIHEEYKLKSAADNIAEFKETNQPIQLWWDSWRDDMADNRSINLSIHERDQAMLQVFELCGIDSSFHQNIRLLKRDIRLNDDIWATEKTFKDATPGPFSIFQWLGDYGLFTRDDANDFDVGFAMDSPVGLVVVKYHSEELFEDDDMIETLYQIALYPREMIHDINWETSKYSDSA